jgi:hypothetical protein
MNVSSHQTATRLRMSSLYEHGNSQVSHVATILVLWLVLCIDISRSLYHGMCQCWGACALMQYVMTRRSPAMYGVVIFNRTNTIRHVDGSDKVLRVDRGQNSEVHWL